MSRILLFLGACKWTLRPYQITAAAAKSQKMEGVSESGQILARQNSGTRKPALFRSLSFCSSFVRVICLSFGLSLWGRTPLNKLHVRYEFICRRMTRFQSALSKMATTRLSLKSFELR